MGAIQDYAERRGHHGLCRAVEGRGTCDCGYEEARAPKPEAEKPKAETDDR